MLKVYVSNVLGVSNVCCVLSGCCICCICYTRMLQVYVSNVLFVFRCMLQVFYLDVAYVVVPIHIKRMFQIFYLFQMYVVTNVLYCKCFMNRRGMGAQAKVVPSGATVPTCTQEVKRVRQQAWSTKLYPWAWQQARSTKQHPWVGSRRGARGEAEHKGSCIHRRLEGIIF
jgi:hypothetical protein